MFYKTSLLAILPLLAAASPALQIYTQCGASLLCCQDVEPAYAAGPSALLGLLGIVVPDSNTLVGINCQPVNIVGVGGSACAYSLVCCNQIYFGGLVAVGCAPVTLWK